MELGEKMLDKKIEYFIAVVQEGSFSGAARKFFLSQPNLSKQVSILEEELGVKLLDRKGYRPLLTKVGAMFYQECLQLQEHCCQLKKQLQQLQKQRLSIGISGSFENRRVIVAINSFKQQYPDFEICFSNMNFENSVKNLLNGVIDVSFGLESTFRCYNNIKYDILYIYDICMICSFEHPLARLKEVTIDQIKNEKMILLSQKYGVNFYKDFIEACKKDGFRPKIQKEVDSFDELVLDVSTNEGIAIVSKDVVSEDEVHTAYIRNTHHHSKYVLAYLQGIEKESIENFRNVIISHFKRKFPENR